MQHLCFWRCSLITTLLIFNKYLSFSAPKCFWWHGLTFTGTYLVLTYVHLGLLSHGSSIFNLLKNHPDFFPMLAVCQFTFPTFIEIEDTYSHHLVTNGHLVLKLESFRVGSLSLNCLLVLAQDLVFSRFSIKIY